MSFIENVIDVSIGVVERVKTNHYGSVKYKISYNDQNGKTHAGWTDWMRDDGYEVGSYIPITFFSLPFFGITRTLILVNNHPQAQKNVMAKLAVLACITSCVAGYVIGKQSPKR